MQIIPESNAIPEIVLTAQQAKDYVGIMCSVFMLNPEAAEVQALITENITKQNINRMMVQMKEASATELGLNAEQSKLLVKFGYGNILYPVSGGQSELDSALRAYEDYNREAMSRLKIACDYAERIRASAGVGIDLSQVLQQVLQNPFYKLRSISADKISFTTAAVTCNEVNPAAKISRSCYMGEYVVEYFPKQGKIKVLEFKNNIRGGGYWHPHVSGSGDVCWGNAASIVKGLIRFELKPVMDALQVILTTYNGESPYADLSKFIAVRTDTGYCYEVDGIVAVEQIHLIVNPERLVVNQIIRNPSGLCFELSYFKRFEPTDEDQDEDEDDERESDGKMYVQLATGAYAELNKVAGKWVTL